jgi:hypothetical protein
MKALIALQEDLKVSQLESMDKTGRLIDTFDMNNIFSGFFK